MKEEFEFFAASRIPWTEDGPGIGQRVLSRDPVDGILTRLACWAPGTVSSPEVTRHAYAEEVYLLEGSLTDLTLGQTFGAGDYACRRPRIPHGPYRSDEGCTMLEIRYRSAG
jgi:hypothetical protein